MIRAACESGFPVLSRAGRTGKYRVERGGAAEHLLKSFGNSLTFVGSLDPPHCILTEVPCKMPPQPPPDLSSPPPFIPKTPPGRCQDTFNNSKDLSYPTPFVPKTPPGCCQDTFNNSKRFEQRRNHQKTSQVSLSTKFPDPSTTDEQGLAMWNLKQTMNARGFPQHAMKLHRLIYLCLHGFVPSRPAHGTRSKLDQEYD